MGALARWQQRIPRVALYHERLALILADVGSNCEAFADRLVFASHHSAGTPMLMQYLRRPFRSETPRRRYKRLKMFLMVCSLVRIWAAISLFL
jgi:hypothetical protein